MKLYVLNKEIKFTSLEWSGSKFNAARRVDFSFPYNVSYKIAQGNPVKLADGKTTLFQGYVFRKELSHKDNEIMITAYDPMVYLLKSRGSYNFKKTTLGAVIKKVAADLGIAVGSIVDSGANIILEPQINIGCYEMILEACREAKKTTKKIYLPVIENNKLVVKYAGEVVKNFELKNGVNLIDSTYSETIENVINKVLIVDEKGNRIGQVTGEGIKTWGTFQDVYEKEDKKNPTLEAKKLLHGLDREASLEALGDTRCISGMAVTIQDSKTGLKGLFYIEEDLHKFEGSKHTMSLTLSYKNEMEE